MKIICSFHRRREKLLLHQICQIFSFRHGGVGFFLLAPYGAASLGDFCPMFRDRVMICFTGKGQTSNCIMTNVMHEFLIYLSIYFCLICFGLSFSSSSEAGVQLRQWFKFPVKEHIYKIIKNYKMINCAFCTPTSEDGLKNVLNM
jgi:hypothetical protein